MITDGRWDGAGGNLYDRVESTDTDTTVATEGQVDAYSQNRKQVDAGTEHCVACVRKFSLGLNFNRNKNVVHFKQLVFIHLLNDKQRRIHCKWPITRVFIGTPLRDFFSYFCCVEATESI